MPRKSIATFAASIIAIFACFRVSTCGLLRSTNIVMSQSFDKGKLDRSLMFGSEPTPMRYNIITSPYVPFPAGYSSLQVSVLSRFIYGIISASTPMSELLVNWLRDDCKLSLPSNCLENAFSNGFLFGEVLFRLDFLQDKSDFRDSDTNTARIINFCRLYHTLKPLNIQFDVQIAIGILSRKNGIAASILLQLKLIADEQTKQMDFGINKSFTSKNLIFRPQRPFDIAMHSLFEQSLRRHLYDLNTKLQTL